MNRANPSRVVNVAGLLLAGSAIFAGRAFAGDGPPGGGRPATVDATTLRRKVMCGYQGWFRCPGDPAGEGWRHWSRDGERIAPGTLTFEMWPDLSESSDDEKYPAAGFTNPDGSPAALFSSANPKTVRRHFEWMRQYGIDGAFVQRFLVELGSPSLDRVLGHVRESAAETGRAYAICYDLSGYPRRRLVDGLAEDWRRLTDELKVTEDDRYLRHGGKPVVFVWGFYSDRFGPEVAHQIIDLFQEDGPHPATLIGGCQWYWRSEKDPEWGRAFRRFDAISPWNVGNASESGGRKRAATGYWAEDLAEAKRAGMDYLPVIYPGFGWTNLRGAGAARATIPRLGGEFYWRQFSEATNLGIEMAYVAMFDEVDEATAIFKVSNSPPAEARFTTYDGLPADWYLRLTGEGARAIREGRKIGPDLPIKP